MLKMQPEKDASPENKITHFILLACLLFLDPGEEVLAVNLTIPTTAIKGAVTGEALLSVRYDSFSSDLPVIKWQLRREKSVTVVQSIGTSIIGTLRPEYRDRILVFENGTLLLHNLRLSDDGTYDVEVSITDDTFPAEGSISLSVDEPISSPYIHMEASSVLELSENFILNCSHLNGTRTAYRWFKGGKPLLNETRFILSADQKLLTIRRVLMADDDIFSCTVENPLGNMSSLPIRLAVYRRSSVYIILSTGGIFFLITMVTVCACWSPSKKPREKPPKSLSRMYGRTHHTPLHQSDVHPKKKERSGKNAITSLYILQQKDPSVEDSSGNRIGSPSGAESPPSYTNSPTYTTFFSGSPAYSYPRPT